MEATSKTILSPFYTENYPKKFVGKIFKTLIERYPDAIIVYAMERTQRSTGNGNGNGVGGLFPAKPEKPPPPTEPDSVCIQVLTPIASMGGGRIVYQVSDAYCDPMAGATCMQGCAGTIGDTVTGVDIIGLIGG